LLKALVEMSDRVEAGASPLDTQGRLLAMQASIQKNRPRVVRLVDALCDMVEARTGKPVV
jgi:hypothetical protein